MHSYIKTFIPQLLAVANGERAAGAKAYMKNQFEFLGIATPERRLICKDYMKQHVLENTGELEVIVKELWELPQREFQYFAIELMSYYKKQWQPSIISLIEHCIVNKSWWDTVDFIASECTGKYFKMFLHQIVPVT